MGAPGIAKVVERQTPITATALESEFSPDGEWLAYVSERSGRNEVNVRRYPSGGNEESVSVDGGSEPRWVGDEIFFRKGRELLVVGVGSSGSESVL